MSRTHRWRLLFFAMVAALLAPGTPCRAGTRPAWRNVRAPLVAPLHARAVLRGRAPLVGSGSETEITPEIQALSRALRHDPQIIYEFVRNNIEYVPIYGSVKGATGTLLDGMGNDFDQSALMIALLRDSGFTATFVLGQVRFTAAQIGLWLGVGTDPNVVGQVLGSAGIPATIFVNGSTLVRVEMEHVWVKVNIAGTDYVFDPSFTLHDLYTKIDLQTALGYDQATFLADATSGATLDPDFIQNANRANIHADLGTYAGNLVNHVRTQIPGARLEEVIGGKRIVPLYNQSLRVTLPYELSRDFEWTDVPAAWETILQVQHLGIDHTFASSEIYGKRLTLFYDVAGAPELRLEGVVVATGTPATPGSFNPITLTVDHPYAAGGGTYGDQVLNSSLEDGSSYVIANSWAGTTRGIVDRHKRIVSQMLADALDPLGEPLLGETLTVLADTWLAEVARAVELTDGTASTHTISHHTVGFTGQRSSPFIDIPLSLVSVISTESNPTLAQSAFFVQGGIASALEWGIFDQLQPITAVSTVKLIDFANTAGDKLFDVTSANWGAVQPQLVNYDAGEISLVDSYVTAGFRLILPQDGDLGEGQWTGMGFLAIAPDGSSIAHIISGGLKGGEGTEPGDADPVTAAEVKEALQNVLHELSNEPIDLVSGDYLYDHVDVTLGSGEYPFAMGFRRYYSSADRLRGGALGFGWTHNFDIHASTMSDGFQGMGEDSPTDAAPAVAEIFAALDLLENASAKENLVVATLSHRWFMDRLIGNLAVVREAQAQWPFVLLPDGSYNPPPGSADQLTVQPDTSFRLRTKKGIVLDFDVNGDIEAWSDPNGNTVTFTYASGLLTSVTNGMGRTLTLAYTGSDLTQVSDGNGRSVSYAYDPAGNLAGATDPLGRTTTYEYDIPGRLLKVFRPAHPLDPFVTNAYDVLGRVATQTDAMGNTWQYFVAAGRRTEELTPLLDSRVWHFDRLGEKTREVDPLGGVTTYLYDGEKRLVSVTYPENNTTAYEYDANHNPTRVTVNAKPGSGDAAHVLDHVYDPVYSRLLSTTEEGSTPRVTTFTYDGSGNLLQIQRPQVNAVTPTLTFTHNARGQVETYTDPMGSLTRYTYDPVTGDHLSTIADEGGLNVTTSMTYDAVGNVVSITDPNGNSATYTWNAGRELQDIVWPAPFSYQTVHTYDADGNLVSIARSTGVPADPWQTRTMTYDLADRIVTETDPAGDVTLFEYDADLRLFRRTDPSLRTVTYEYDGLDRVTRVTDGRGVAVEEYTFTPNGMTDTLTDGNANVTAIEWDGLDRLGRIVYPDGTFESFSYDEFNNISQKQLRSGRIASFSYDALDRLTSEFVPGSDGANVLYDYDLNGRLLDVTDAGGVMSFTYDPLGRPLSAAYPGIGSVLYQYDSMGNRVRLDHPDGFFVTYSYDAMNRLSEVLEGGTTLLAHYDWDDLSRRALVTFGNGATAQYTYAADDDLTQVLHQFTSTSLPLDYTHDAGGRRLSRATPSNTASYLYDAAGQLERVTNSAASPAQTDFVYDGAGNRVTVTADGHPTAYAVNPLNEYTQVGTRAFAWDADGNLRSDGRRTFTYDALDRLRRVEDRNRRVRFSYDPFGRRRTKRVDGVRFPLEDSPDPSGGGSPAPEGRVSSGNVYVPGPTTTYVWDEGQVIAELDEQGQTLRRFIYGDGLDDPVAMETGGGGGATHFYHADALGSVVALSDANGDAVETYEYDAYGRPSAPSALGNPYLFTGRRYDPETGLYDYRARFYDPALGRFLQADPAGHVDDVNLYRYVRNDPADLTDPTGEWALIDNLIAGGVGALGGVIGQGVSDLINGELSSWETYSGAAVGGAVAAEVVLHTGNPWLAGAAGGEASAITQQGLENLSGYISTGEWKGFDAGQVVQSTVLGGVTGGVLDKVKIKVPGINAGRNSYGAIYKQIITKLERGTIKNVSKKTILKMITYQGTQALPSTLLGGDIDGIKRGIEQILKTK